MNLLHMSRYILILSTLLVSFLSEGIGQTFLARSSKFVAVNSVDRVLSGALLNSEVKTAGGAITAGPVTGNISACAGTASVSPNIQQVTISGTGLIADIKATAPTGFEVSLNPVSGYAGSVLLTQLGGIVTNKTVYVRSAATATGDITGALILSSVGASNRNLLVNGIISAIPTVNKVTDQTKINGEATNPVSFTGTTKYFTWTNDNPSIGLPASGIGDIASFIAVNNSGVPVKANITATPQPVALAYIANYGANNVSVINTATNNIITTIPVGSNPYTVTASKDGNRVYVVNSISNNVSVISTSTNAVIATIDVGANPLGAIISEDGSRLYVINKGTNSVSFINTISTEVIKTIQLNAVPYNIAISKDGGTLFITNYETNTVSVVDIATETISDIAVNPGPFGIVLSPDGSKLYVTNELDNKFSVIDVATKIVTASIPVGQTPYGIAVSPDGSRIYVSCAVENKIEVINAANNAFITSVDVGEYPYGISVSDDGSQVYSVNLNSSDVTVVNTATNSVATTTTVGHNPYSLGMFVAKSSGCSGSPVSFTITVMPVKPIITAGSVSGNITACSGSVSSSPNIQQFSVSGSALAADVTATAPAGFEISLAPATGYAGSLSIAQSAGTITNKVVYVRSAATATGNISGNVVLSSSGAVNSLVAVKGTINQLPTVTQIPDQIKAKGDLTDAVTFTGSGPIYTWVNDNPQIGLAANGAGNIASFKTLNNTGSDITANITVLPQSVGYAYVANVRSTISVINSVTNEVVETIPAGFGSEPDQIAINADGSRAYITNIGSNTISVINTLTNKILNYIPVGEGPTGIVISPDGKKLYVGITGDNTIIAIDLATNKISNVLDVGAKCHRLAISPDGSKLYAIKYSDKVIAIDIPSFSVTDEIVAGAGPNNLVISPDGKQLYVVSGASSDVSVINTAINKVTAIIKTGVLSTDIAMSPYGSRLYVTNINDGTVSVINTALDAAHAVIDVIPVGYTPNVISISADGSKLYVTHNQTNDITIINTQTNKVVAGGPTIDDGPLAIKFTPGIGCTGAPITFKITVKPNAGVPAITTNGTLTALTATYSKASSTSTSFNVSGTSLTTGILVTPPTGFEVSTDNVNFSHTLTVGAAGTVATTTLYVRLAPVTNAGTYSGNILLTSVGATDVTVPTILSTVNRAVLTVSALDLHKNFGTNIYGAANAFSFTAEGLQNSEVIGSVTIAYGEGALATDPPAVYPQSVTVRDATGGTFNPDNYTINYLPGSLTVDPPPTPIFTLNYTPQAVSTVYGTPSGFTSFLVSGSQMQGSILITPPAGFEVSTDNITYSNTVQFGAAGFIPQTAVYIRLKATTPVQAYSGNVVVSSPGTSSVTEFIPNSVVSPASLTITPITVNKAYGDYLIGGPNFTTFTSMGLQNGETIGSVTVTYAAGAAASDNAGTYVNSIVPSQATGGTFNPDNYIITYIPGDLVVSAAPAIPVISFTKILSTLTTTYGTPSTSTSFTVSATDATAGIAITPPAGFEVSFDNIAFAKTISIGSAGSLSESPVYIRLSPTADVGSYPGDVLLSTPGALNKYVSLLNSTVTPAPLTITTFNTTKTYGDNLIVGAGYTNFTSSGLENGETIGSLSVIYVAGSAAADYAGTYTGALVPGSATGGTFKASNYHINYVNADVIVNKAVLTITALNNSRKYGEPNPILELTYSGFKNDEDASILTTQPLVSTTATLLSPVGIYPIKVGGAVATNYDFNYVNGTLNIEPLSIAIVVPNAFSPNGDGQNDTWNIKNIQNYPGNTVDVYNRYGEKLYSSIGYGTPWNGRYNGIDLPFGTYYYIINPKNGSSVISGYVTIIK
jgi:gliding motility-associated-like protein